MDFYVLTLFPDMIAQGLGTSITGRAIKKGTIGLHTLNIRDFSTDKHKRVDDYTYGGGAGMLMQPQPVYDAWHSVVENIPQDRNVRTIYVTPQGQPFTQKLARKFAKSDELIFLCGHYEGIDERVLEETVTDYVSIGDYVLTGGELAAMVMIDAISRMVPGVLHNDVSAETESFHGSLLEYPQYSRPEEWHGKRVPEVLLSGNQKQVDIWRKEQQEIRTKSRRPDLYAEYTNLQSARKKLMKSKLLCMDMITKIDTGRAEILSGSEDNYVILRDELTGEILVSNPEGTDLNTIIADMVTDQTSRISFHEEADAERFMNSCQDSAYRMETLQQAVLTRREKLPVTGLYRPDGRPTVNGVTVKADERDKFAFTAYKDNLEAGRIRLGEYGAMTDLYVRDEYRGQKLALALETCLCNYLLEQNMVAYCQYLPSETISGIQKKLGLYEAKTPVYIIEK